jgi:hypothetical protein
MKYKLEYATVADFEAAVQEAHKDLFEVRGDKVVFVGVEGMKTDTDVHKLQTALAKERDDHKAAKSTLKGLVGDRTAEETVALLDSVPELIAAVENSKKPDDERINSLVEARIRSRLTPVERERETLKTAKADYEQRIAKYEASDRMRAIQSTMLIAMRGGSDGKGPKVLPVAEEDVLLAAERVMQINEDGTVSTKDGADPVTWLYEVSSRKPHWYEPSGGGGAKGSSAVNGASFASNPWTKKHWNATNQGREIRADRNRAEQMAKAAGSHIGATAPASDK